MATAAARAAMRRPHLVEDDGSEAKLATNSHAEWLRVDEIVVDQSYQRDINPNHVGKLASTFNPDAVGAIDVGKRADGRYYCIDGQHRLLAMKQRGMGEYRVLCNVWLSDGPKFEAAIFIAKNDGRKSVPSYSRYRARIRAGSLLESNVQAMLDQLGIRAVSSLGKGHGWGRPGEPAELWAIGALCDLFSRAPAQTRAALTVLRDLYSEKYPRAYEANMLRGLVTFLCEHEGEIGVADVKAALATTNPDEIIDQAQMAKGNRSYALYAFVAAAIADTYNAKHRRAQIAASLPKTYALSIRNHVMRTPR